MKDKLIKIENTFYSLYDSDGDIIASNNPKTPTTKKLSIKNCEAIERGYDLFELAYDSSKEFLIESTHSPSFTFGYEQGFKKALEILGDKKFSEEDIKKAFNVGWIQRHNEEGSHYEAMEKVIQSLQQTKEWDVEICCYLGNGDKESDSFKDTFVTNTGIPKLDSDGCLILRRI